MRTSYFLGNCVSKWFKHRQLHIYYIQRQYEYTYMHIYIYMHKKYFILNVTSITASILICSLFFLLIRGKVREDHRPGPLCETDKRTHHVSHKL